MADNDNIMKAMLVEFIIPSYKRPHGAVKAANSVVEQMLHEKLNEFVSVRIVDDATPGETIEAFEKRLGQTSNYVTINVNSHNKGMSRNIYDIVRGSTAEFCTILTDDDWLHPGSLFEIVRFLKRARSDQQIGAIFTPRYSYLEDGELHCIVCKPFPGDRRLGSGNLNALRYCVNGFILTGFIFRPQFIDYTRWSENLGNAYFPIINFAGVLARHDVMFLDRNWFQHTVLNVCHWEAWGADEFSQTLRLYWDFMDAISMIARIAFYESRSVQESLIIWQDESRIYTQQFKAIYTKIDGRLSFVSRRTWVRPAFLMALLKFHMKRFLRDFNKRPTR